MIIRTGLITRPDSIYRLSSSVDHNNFPNAASRPDSGRAFHRQARRHIFHNDNAKFIVCDSGQTGLISAFLKIFSILDSPERLRFPLRVTFDSALSVYNFIFSTLFRSGFRLAVFQNKLLYFIRLSPVLYIGFTSIRQ